MISSQALSLPDSFTRFPCLALRRPLRDVEKNNVAKLFQRREMSQGSADLTGSDQCDLAARHF
jgi:hypothetical protein